VVDVSQASAPRLLGTVDVAWSVPAGADRLYVRSGYRGLRLLDVSDPAQVVDLGGVQLELGEGQQAVLSGDWLYLFDGDTSGTGGLRSYDVSDPAQPRRVGAYRTTGSVDTVRVAGSRAFLKDATDKLQVVDLADPTAPRDLAVTDFVLQRPLVAVSETLLLGRGPAGLQLVDVSDPDQPALVSVLPGLEQGDFQDAVVVGTRVYVAFGAQGLRIVDIADPTRPTAVGAWGSGGQQRAIWVAVDGPMVYLGQMRETGSPGDTPTGISVIDATDPSQPRELPFYPWLFPFRGLAAAPGRVYVSGQRRANPNELFGAVTLHVLDTTDPSAPVLQPSVALGFAPDTMALQGTCLVVVGTPSSGDRTRGVLKVLDFSDPQQPRALAEAITATPHERGHPGLAFQGNTIYLGDNEAGLWLYQSDVLNACTSPEAD
jgi:hypothetical protein